MGQSSRRDRTREHHTKPVRHASEWHEGSSQLAKDASDCTAGREVQRYAAQGGNPQPDQPGAVDVNSAPVAVVSRAKKQFLERFLD